MEMNEGQPSLAVIVGQEGRSNESTVDSSTDYRPARLE